jgi:hypothetical protein
MLLEGRVTGALTPVGEKISALSGMNSGRVNFP